MNIPKIQNINLFQSFKANENNAPQNYTTNFGLRMSSPLSRDSVSFRGGKSAAEKAAEKALKAAKKAVAAAEDAIKEGERSNKKAAAGKFLITTQDAKGLRKAVYGAHNRNVELFMSKFGHLFSEKDKTGKITRRNLITFEERIKSEFSIIQKVGSIAEDKAKKGEAFNIDKDTLLKEMTDVSGIEIILEKTPEHMKSKVKKSKFAKVKTPNVSKDNLAMEEVVKIFKKMIEDGEVVVDEIEYHRCPGCESLDANLVEELMKAAKEARPKKCKCKPVSNPVGYSALHIKLKNADGTYTEFKIISRAVANVQDVENMFYKTQNGKKVAEKYKTVGEMLAKLKPLSEDAIEEERQIHKATEKALLEYKKQVYKIAAENPLEDIKEFPVPINPLVKPYGFNIVRSKMDECLREYAEKAKINKN